MYGSLIRYFMTGGKDLSSSLEDSQQSVSAIRFNMLLDEYSITRSQCTTMKFNAVRNSTLTLSTIVPLLLEAEDFFQ